MTTMFENMVRDVITGGNEQSGRFLVSVLIRKVEQGDDRAAGLVDEAFEELENQRKTITDLEAKLDASYERANKGRQLMNSRLDTMRDSLTDEIERLMEENRRLS